MVFVRTPLSQLREDNRHSRAVGTYLLEVWLTVRRLFMLIVWAGVVATAVGTTPPRAVVVGAGVGGLYTAARLARQGVLVTLIEKNSRAAAGGRLACESVVAENGREYRFETGPSLLLLPSVYREALSTIGLDPDEYLDLARCEPSYAVHFDDGHPTPLEIGGDASSEHSLKATMEAVEPGSYGAYMGYLASARANLGSGLPIFIREQFGPKALATLPRFLRSALLGPAAADSAPLRDWPLRGHGAQLKDIFSSARHRELAAFQDLYVGLSPAQAPAVFSLLQAIELCPAGCESSDSGVFYPRGGWGTVREALLKAVEDAGVECLWGTSALEILVEEGEVRGVRAAQSPSADADTAQVAASSEVVDLCNADPNDEFRATFGGPSRVGEGDAGSGSVSSAPVSFVLPADCVVVNADLATAEASLLPATLRRSEYTERSEVTAEQRNAAIARALGEAATAAATLVKTAAGTAVPGLAEPAERMAAPNEPPATTAREGLLRAGGWQYSSSTVSFYFCLDTRFRQLRHHNVFLAGPEAWEGLFDADQYTRWDARMATGPMHFYVHAPARTDPTVVQRSSDDAVMVLVPVPPIDERLTPAEADAATERLVRRAREAVIRTFEAAGMEGFGSSIVDERVRTPPGWRDAYGLRRGSVFGLSHSLQQLALARPARRHPSVRGLHWVGANTRPGNGVPLVMIGAMKTAEEALVDLSSRLA